MNKVELMEQLKHCPDNVDIETVMKVKVNVKIAGCSRDISEDMHLYGRLEHIHFCSGGHNEIMLVSSAGGRADVKVTSVIDKRV